MTCMAAVAGLAVYYSVASDWYGIVAFIAMWIVVTASCQVFCRHARTPRVFGVPLFPWVPSGELFLAMFRQLWASVNADEAVGYQRFLQHAHVGPSTAPVCCAGSMILNCFLLCTLDRDSYIRFGIWSLFCIVIYLLYSLHSIDYHHKHHDSLPEYQCALLSCPVPAHDPYPACHCLYRWRDFLRMASVQEQGGCC